MNTTADVGSTRYRDQKIEVMYFRRWYVHRCRDADMETWEDGKVWRGMKDEEEG